MPHVTRWGTGCLLLLLTCAPARPAEAPSFVHDVEPLLTRLGCNQGSCHGKGAGQNGFRLSLRGYAPELDYLYLTREFDGTFSPETIERFLHSSYDEFASRAVVVNYLPLLAERFARQRLRALAKVEGKHDSGVPVVLFLCTHNAGRSQMALGFFQHLAGDGAVAWSGGSAPATEINPAAIAAMRERGIDISHEYPKPWTDEVVRAADVVVTMGCGDACPAYPGKRYEDWVLDDPEGLGIEAVRPIRDEIRRRVEQLLEEMKIAPE